MSHFHDQAAYDKACPPALNAITDNLLKIVKSQQEEEREWNQKKLGLIALIEKQRDNIRRLELEKSQIDDEVLTLKLRDKAYQKEHTCLRNAVTVVKYQIEKIRESIALVKANELKDLENFEKTVDEITEKFRSSPSLYDRKNLMSRINEEKAVTKQLTKDIEEISNKFKEFNRGKGLRERVDENEDLLNCVLPNSELYHLIQMGKNLDIVIADIKNATKDIRNKEAELQELDDVASSLISKINEIKDLGDLAE